MSDGADRLDRSLSELQEMVESLLSQSLGKRYGQRPRQFSHLLSIPMTISALELKDLLESAEAAGRITFTDANRVIGSHLLFRDAGSSTPTYLIVEAERTIQVEHVRRVQRRATVLRKAGVTVSCAVAGLNIQRDALELIAREGVGRVIEQELDGEDPTAGAVDAPWSSSWTSSIAR